MKKLNSKCKVKKSERDLVVTRGYLEDTGFVTRGYLEEVGMVTKDYLEEVGMVTKDYLNECLQKFGDNLTRNLVMQLGSLIENQNMHYDALYQENIAKLDNHEIRIVKLENRQI